VTSILDIKQKRSQFFITSILNINIKRINRFT